ncbi:carboxypeptidase B isoform X3 [Spodoptera frugiperda]|uniref:Carboxypeptidase B isoform X3 n=1 Tax=Spodoptera frugiperda TaxID=7108 RepID=A0A9R0D7E9_SPOFR|nr:carboxypeptidase B isoform X3 [Spodoptera frugiperda]
MLRVGCLFLIIGLALAKHEVYDGYGLYKVSVKTTDQVELVNYLSKALDLDVWSHAIPGHDGQVLVPKDKKSLFQNELKAAGVEFQIESDNIKDILDLEDQLLSEAARKNNGSRLDSLPFDQIYTYHQVDTFLEMLAAAYPETVTLVNAGKSFEGRDIKYIKVSSGDFETSTKPIVFMESLLHAREWITLPATLYAIHKLVIDVTEQDLIQDIDWIILPIANPDGYVHSHGESRLWRKNRNTNLGVGCMGVDLNRNFDINWSTASSSIPCLDNYHGRGPFSEPEASAIKSIFDQYIDRIGLFLDIHSFGSMILYAYGNGVLPPNGLMIHLLGVRMAESIDAVKMSWNPNYIVGNSALVLYDDSGTASDYAQSIGVPYSYAYELPGHRFGIGGFGFFVDPAFIEQAGFETWEGIKTGARFIRDNFTKSKQSLS